MSNASTIIGVPAYGASDWLGRCLARLDTYTPPHVEIIVWDDGTPDDSVAAAVADVASARVSYLRSDTNRGFVASCNAIFQIAGRSDVILVNSDVLVTRGWFEGLQAAAYSGDRVATATALTNNGTVTSVRMPQRFLHHLAEDNVIDLISSRITTHYEATHPDLPTAVGHCMYIRRSAIDLIGMFDEAFSPGYGEEVDFSQRCISIGLNHVLADNAYVYHAGGGSFDAADQGAPRSSRIRDEHEIMIHERYPWYQALVADFIGRSDSLLSSSVLRAASAIDGIGVTIDGRCFSGPATGTQVQTAHLIRGLHQLGNCRLRILVPDVQCDFFHETVGSLPGVDLLRISSFAANTPKTEIVHRPYQVTSLDDLRLLHDLGSRLVISQLDFIAFNSPNYFDSREAWLDYRIVTEVALAESSHTLFISSHARGEGLRLGLVDDERSSVVYCGTDHALSDDGSGVLPRGVRHPFILCLGTDFAHKNRAFAIRVLGAMRQVHGWDGQLVLAGPHAGAGNGSAAEKDAELTIGEDCEHVVDLGSVTEGARNVLLREARCVICPTTYEGFGLVPFEAASHGTPCVYSLRTSHVELLPDAGNTIPEWDPLATGQLVLRIISDDAVSQSIVRNIRLAGSARTWLDTADRTLCAYHQALQSAPNKGGTVRRIRELLEAQLAIRDRAVENLHRALDRTHEDFERQVKDSEPSVAFAHAIPGPFHGSLSFAARHRALRILVLWPLRVVFSTTRRLHPK